MTFQIEKGIPFLRVARGRLRGEFLRTCAAMEVDDSFLAPASFGKQIAQRTKALRPKRFGYNSVDSEHIRVWRVE